MSEFSTLNDSLDRLGHMVNEDRNLTVKALGLLIGLPVEDDDKVNEKRDPTDFILRDPGVRVPQE